MRGDINPASRLALHLAKLPVAELASDLPLMLKPSLLPLRIDHHTRRSDVKLRHDAIADLSRNINRITQERTEIPDRRQLHAKTQPVVIATTTSNKPQITVIEKEEPLQLGLRQQPSEAPIRLSLRISQELDGQPQLKIPADVSGKSQPRSEP